MGIFGRRKRPQAARDPVCGMVLVQEESIGPDVIRGQAYYFCSTQCQDTYHESTGTRMSRRGRMDRDAKHPVKGKNGKAEAKANEPGGLVH